MVDGPLSEGGVQSRNRFTKKRRAGLGADGRGGLGATSLADGICVTFERRVDVDVGLEVVGKASGNQEESRKKSDSLDDGKSGCSSALGYDEPAV